MAKLMGHGPNGLGEVSRFLYGPLRWRATDPYRVISRGERHFPQTQTHQARRRSEQKTCGHRLHIYKYIIDPAIVITRSRYAIGSIVIKTGQIYIGGYLLENLANKIAIAAILPRCGGQIGAGRLRGDIALGQDLADDFELAERHSAIKMCETAGAGRIKELSCPLGHRPGSLAGESGEDRQHLQAARRGQYRRTNLRGGFGCRHRQSWADTAEGLRGTGGSHLREDAIAQGQKSQIVFHQHIALLDDAACAGDPSGGYLGHPH